MEPENLKEYYERRFREIKLGLDRTPGLREHFFFVYELPDGTRRGELLISSGAFRDALTRAMERIDCGETLEYMCRRLGREHGIDTKEPVRGVRKTPEEIIESLRSRWLI